MEYRLEKMAEFFENRLDGYDAHMLNEIDSAGEFYAFTASCLPKECCYVLDLGCGTGLEMEFYLKSNPNAHVTGIDLSYGMLEEMKKKFDPAQITLIRGSYFDVPFGEHVFDAAVSVESLHHFTEEEKIPLYRKLHGALKENGYLILTDYFADTEDQEQFFQSELIRMKKEQGLADHVFYHYDTPFTAAHEMQCLRDAGFSHVEEMQSWGSTHTLKAIK